MISEHPPLQLDAVVLATHDWTAEQLCDEIQAHYPGVIVVRNFLLAGPAIDFIEEKKVDLIIAELDFQLFAEPRLEKLLHDKRIQVVLIPTAGEDANGIGPFPVLGLGLFASFNGKQRVAQPGQGLAGGRLRPEGKDKGLGKLTFSNQDCTRFVSPNEVVMCKSDNTYTTIFLESGDSMVVSRSLKKVEQQLQGLPFYRAHQSYLVNLYHIKEFRKRDGGFLVLTQGLRAVVARNNWNELRTLLSSGLQGNK